MEPTIIDLRELSAAAIVRGDHTAAADMIATMFASNPNDPRAHQQWGRLLLAQGEIADAVEASRQAAELAPLDPALRLELAQTLLTQAFAEGAHRRDRVFLEARREARRALAIQSDYEGAHRLIDQIEEQRLIDSLTAADRVPVVIPDRHAATRQYKMPTTTARLANYYSLGWAALVLLAFVFILWRVAG